MPKISVNIPCFNSSVFINQTLESVLGQTYRDFEVIVMDDGSTDDTKSKVHAFRDGRIKYFYKANEGLAGTRNRGIAASTGEYIAFLDHDDLWTPQKLEAQMAILERDRDVGLVFSDAHVLKDGKKERATYFDRCKPKRGSIFEDLLLESSNFIPLSSVMMRRNVFDEIGCFKTEFKIGEEYELFLRAADRYRFDYVDEPLAVIRMHEGNFSARKEIFVKEAFDILEFWKTERPELLARAKERFSKKEAALLSEIANFYALNSRKPEALENFNRSLVRYNSRGVLMKKYILFLLGCGAYKMISALFNRIRYAD